MFAVAQEVECLQTLAPRTIVISLLVKKTRHLKCWVNVPSGPWVLDKLWGYDLKESNLGPR